MRPNKRKHSTNQPSSKQSQRKAQELSFGRGAAGPRRSGSTLASALENTRGFKDRHSVKRYDDDDDDEYQTKRSKTTSNPRPRGQDTDNSADDKEIKYVGYLI